MTKRTGLKIRVAFKFFETRLAGSIRQSKNFAHVKFLFIRVLTRIPSELLTEKLTDSAV